MKSRVSTVIIIPSFNETLALPELLKELVLDLTNHDAILVMDDSPKGVSEEIKRKCQDVIKDADVRFRFDNSGSKSGRGAAVRRGMILAVSEFPNFERILECDADGSHRPADIVKMKNSVSNADLLVGSRYLHSSKIVGWPASRRVFSWLLNKLIPQLMHVDLSDITNGLRRYSRSAVAEILSESQVNKGFIYLTEQALLISRAKLKIAEEPIVFVDRALGRSTVTWREIADSVYGIFKLAFSKAKR